MKDKLHISEFRKELPFHIDKSTSIVVYLYHLLDRYKVDWDVYLPSKGINLQRPFVWTLEQKQELILSILKGIKIPNVSVIQYDYIIEGKKSLFQIIDGKQRISSMLSFLKGEFPIIWKNEEYYYEDLGETSKGEIRLYTLIGDKAYEDDDVKISDDAKIAWFEMINFSGTPQDKEHLLNLKK